MPYSNKEYKTSNINYLNKDFSSIKRTLIEYAKTYFPNTYRDFNETSPGMMMMELTAYVGDVLSFYIDQQYKEMLLPLSEERKNIINMSKMLGYKVKPINPAFVELTFTQEVDAVGDLNNLTPDYTQTFIIDKGALVESTTDSAVTFETLSEVDFNISGAFDPPVIESTFDENGAVSTFELTRTVMAISGETKSTVFDIGSPEKFLKLTLPEENVIEVLEVKDSNNNKWHQVDYLAQDKVPIETHYTNDADREYDSLTDLDQSLLFPTIHVPYTLQYLKTPKRYITEVNEDNTTSLVFGNGILKTTTTGSLATAFHASQQAGLTIPGDINDHFNSEIDLRLGNSFATLGEAPSNTTLTVTYRTGGGITSNVPSNDLTTLTTKNIVGPTDKQSSIVVTNNIPAAGGSSGDTIEEIRKKASAHFATQNRCVTKEDYEARVLSMPAKYGSIAKIYVERPGDADPQEIFNAADTSGDTMIDFNEFSTAFVSQMDGQVHFPTIDIHILSYDNNKNLVKPNLMIERNLKHYLSNFRILTDEVKLLPGKVINFGVVFDIVAQKSANKQDVKLRCINKIIEYFNIDTMQFKQKLFTSEIEYILMGIEGVRSVNYVRLTQNFFGADALVDDGVVLWSRNSTLGDPDSEVFPADPASGHTGLYGYEYDFEQFYENSLYAGEIMPSLTPSVFELKNPETNVKGIVR